MSSAAWSPATPPPTTRALWCMETILSSRGAACVTPAMAIFTWSIALRVAPSLSCMCTHEQCSRMFTIWNRYGFRPASSHTFMKVGPCIFTLQAATTTRFSLNSSMSLLIWIWPGSAQLYMFSLDITTFGRVAAYCATAAQSTVWAMSVSYTHLRAHETRHDLVCRLLL